jgi:hypothetical protein
VIRLSATVPRLSLAHRRLGKITADRGLRLIRFNLVWLLLMSGILHAATLTEHMDIECRQPSPQSLDCDYRILNGQELAASTAEYDGITLPGGKANSPSGEPSSSAILFVVDTSDPSRSAALEQNRTHIQKIVEVAGPGHQFGLSAFDSELNVLCPFDCAAQALIESSEKLLAKGKTTELYRNLLEAIKYLRGINSPHRNIILMSDGLAEDLAYFHHDVVAAARKDRIVISAIGYPRSVLQSVALQTLRRLAEETGGVFIPADPADHAIPNSAFPRLLALFNSVGRLSFRLDEIPLTSLA